MCEDYEDEEKGVKEGENEEKCYKYLGCVRIMRTRGKE